MPTTEIINALDTLTEEIETMEQDPHVVAYLAKKEELEAGLNELRMQAQSEGNFQTRFFLFKRVERVSYNWRKIVEKLHDAKRITDSDIEPFKEEKIYGEARRITSRDSEVTT